MGSSGSYCIPEKQCCHTSRLNKQLWDEEPEFDPWAEKASPRDPIVITARKALATRPSADGESSPPNDQDASTEPSEDEPSASEDEESSAESDDESVAIIPAAANRHLGSAGQHSFYLPSVDAVRSLQNKVIQRRHSDDGGLITDHLPPPAHARGDDATAGPRGGSSRRRSLSAEAMTLDKANSNEDRLAAMRHAAGMLP
eukprot:TRINITY_DN14101_c0_g1_i1.p1 TRINITY_DN14101_c0_g1~~TRINITY_DN14101_c0_g1_i1.p1  ORF type:complete len:200 (+),score=46.34 TRINITY_DN14101_c0_g1_i1:80-679(+)